MSRARQQTLNKIAAYETGQAAIAQAAAAPAAVGATPAQRVKCDDTSKPGLLTPEYTPAEFDAWKRDFQTYFLANRLDAPGVTIAEQRLAQALQLPWSTLQEVVEQGEGREFGYLQRRWVYQCPGGRVQEALPDVCHCPGQRRGL